MSTGENIQRGTSKYLFICYSHRDVSIVEKEAEWLRRQGFRLWYDDNIAAGHPWSEELAESIAGASAVLYFLSKHSAGSSYCIDELHFAKDRNIPIVPIEIEPVKLSPGLQLTLGSKQFVRMTDTTTRGYRNKLAAGLSAMLASKRAPDATVGVEEFEPSGPRLNRARIAGICGALVTLGILLALP